MKEHGHESAPEDAWSDGSAYERYVGRWSRPVAREFLRWLDCPPDGSWLDVGCGTGALSQTILELASPEEVCGVDPSSTYVAYAGRAISEPRARFLAGDARRLPFASARFDVAVSGLVLNFVPEPGEAVAEMARVTRPGGEVAAYVWDYEGQMQLMRHFWEAAAALDPEALELDEGRRFSLCRPEPLTEVLRAVGLRNVEVRAIDVPTVFEDFEDFWSPFLGGQGPAPGYLTSLSEERSVALRERLRASLPTSVDGSIHLIARAWAVRGEPKDSD